MKKHVFVSMVAMTALAIPGMAADTFYVATNGVDAVGRGGEESPFQTIQYAIDSATVGSTIWVKPGIYDKGGAVSVNGTTHSNRVVLTKRVYLRSTDGASVTHIVGAPDPDTGGVGPKGVRCIISPSDNNALDSRIVGFTLRDGYGDVSNHRSGGFLQHHGRKEVYISDCVVSNCASYTHGGARGGTFSRCLFANNRVTSEHGTYAAGAGQANFINCIFVGNGDSSSDCAVSEAVLVNCTVVCNRGYGTTSGCSLYNSVVCGNAYVNYSGSTAHDSAIGGYPIYSPLDQDYRVVSGSSADGTGNPAYLQQGTRPFTVVDDMAEKDFAGNSIDVSAGHIHAGALQQTVGATDGGILYLNGPLSCNGLSVRDSVPTYAQSTNHLTQWVVNFAGSKTSGSVTNHLVRIFRKSGASNYGQVLQVADDNSLVMMVPPKSGLATTNTPEYCKARWVDPVLGSDTANDGSQLAPYRTIQKALDEGKNDTVVLLAPGIYAEGGVSSEDPSVAPYVSTRVWITNSNVRIVGVAGAANTVIVGSPDPATGGLGDGAIRCAASTTGYSWMSGVTLSNGWTRAGSGNQGEGAAIDGNLFLTDSIVTDCHGHLSVLHAARIYRCKVYGNEALNDSLVDGSGGRVVCSWLGPNKSKSSSYYGYLGSDVEAWFTTLVMEEGRSLFSQRASLYNCLAVNGQYVKQEMKSLGNLFWNFSEIEAAAVGTFTNANPRLRKDKMHVSSLSPALSAGVAPSETRYDSGETFSSQWHTYSSADMEGNPIRFNNDGTALAGAFQEPDWVRPVFSVSFR